MEQDAVDRIVEQWNRERPDVDVSGMEVIGRISRLARVIGPRLDEVFARFGLGGWEFDVLATLRRSGAPYQLTAGALLSSMMVTSATMTNRIDRLEERDLIRRDRDRSDRRVVLVSLTEAGRAVVDDVLPEHAANEERLLASLSTRERESLARLLRKLHLGLAGPAPPRPAG